MKLKKYERLREKYPEYISLDQLYKICRISKRSALYLVENGIIPVEDTGKKTWRYRIALCDVITYLRRREQVGSMIPMGSASSRGKRPDNPRKSFSSLILPGCENEVSEYFNYIYADYPDVLNAADISEMTGLSKKTILLYLKDGTIKSLGISNQKYVIPKVYLLKFITTPTFIDCKSNSEAFKKVLGGFEIWKTAK